MPANSLERASTWEQAVAMVGVARPMRCVLRLIERTIDRRGRTCWIVPELTLEGWTTSWSATRFDAAAIIAPYADHGTHERFHPEFTTDPDLTRLPSGTFDTDCCIGRRAGCPGPTRRCAMRPNAGG